VLEEGKVTHPMRGTPQGGVISPLLSNIVLHEVDRQWSARPNAAADVPVLVRYADDRAPRAQRRPEGPTECVTVQLMRGGPSEPACRSRFQTTSGCCGQKPWW
jgi:RNA-directed DNA polymerase